MEDSSNEKVKHEQQRRNIMYMLFGQYVYTYIHMCKICYFSHLALKLFLEMSI